MGVFYGLADGGVLEGRVVDDVFDLLGHALEDGAFLGANLSAVRSMKPKTAGVMSAMT